MPARLACERARERDLRAGRAVLVDAEAGLAVAPPGDDARELTERLHDQRHALARREGAVHLELGAADGKVQHAAGEDSRGGPQVSVPEHALARPLPALAQVE